MTNETQAQNVTNEDNYLLDDYAESCKACKSIRKSISLVANSAACDCLLNAFETEQKNRLYLKFKLQQIEEFTAKVEKLENLYLE